MPAQVPDMDGGPIIGGQNQAGAVRGEGGQRHLAEVGAFELRQRAARFSLDQANIHTGVLNHQHAAVGRKTVARAADLSRLGPGSDGPQPAGRVSRHQPFSVRAEKYVDQTVNRQMGHFAGIAHIPDVRTVDAVAAGRQPLPVRADRETSAILQRTKLYLTIRCQDVRV